MKFIKKHKFTVLVILAFVVLVLILAVVKNIFFGGSGRPAYGNRLDGIENVKIEEKRYDELATKLKKNDKVEDASCNLSGKIINVIITVSDKTSKKDAKSIGSSVLEEFSKDELAFYDVQVYIKKKDAKQNDFPIIGYKHHKNKSLSWSKDRKVTTSEK